MNKSYDEGLALATEVIQIAKDELAGHGVELILCTPSIHLPSVSKLIGSHKNLVSTGAQNCYPKPSGAFTGEISAEIIKSTGAQYVILGHSERREYFLESDAFLLEKLEAVITAGLTPIFCCGESLTQREKGGYLEFVASQLDNTVLKLSVENQAKVILAYEPIWAIGTGLSASAEQAQEMHAYLRQYISKHSSEEVAGIIPILYGGSVKASNAAEIFGMPDVDGGLVGGASLQSREFINIAKGFSV